MAIERDYRGLSRVSCAPTMALWGSMRVNGSASTSRLRGLALQVELAICGGPACRYQIVEEGILKRSRNAV